MSSYHNGRNNSEDKKTLRHCFIFSYPQNDIYKLFYCIWVGIYILFIAVLQPKIITTEDLHLRKSFHFRYYGLWLWFPELFNRLNQYYKIYPNESKTVCEIVDMDFKPPPSNDSSTKYSYHDDEFCSNPVPDSEVFLNSIYVSLAAAPGNIWSIIHMDKLGRKFFLGK